MQEFFSVLQIKLTRSMKIRELSLLKYLTTQIEWASGAITEKLNLIKQVLILNSFSLKQVYWQHMMVIKPVLKFSSSRASLIAFSSHRFFYIV